MRRRIRIALQLLIAAPLDEEKSSVQVYDMLKKEPKVIAWLWDRSGTGDFVKGGKQHFNLAEKIVKKHKLGKDYLEQEEKAEEIADSSVRGYYFPESNQIAIYPIKRGSRYAEPRSDVFSIVSQKLGGNTKTNGIAIQDEYYVSV